MIAKFVGLSKTAHSTNARGNLQYEKYTNAPRIIFFKTHFPLRKYIAQWRLSLQLPLVFRNSHFSN